MGNSQFFEFTFVKTYDDRRFGLITIWQRNNQLILHKAISLQNPQQQKDYFTLCQKAQNDSHPSLLKIFQSESVGENINVYMEFYERDLGKEIQQRSSEQVPFTEEEIKILMQNLFDVGEYFQFNGVYHGDLRATNILLDDNGKAKIADYGLIQPIKSNTISTLYMRDRSYLSPELLQAIQKRDKKPTLDYTKNDVFTLGMTFLEVCLLNNVYCCYNWNNLKIVWSIVEELLTQIKQTYSSHLVQIIQQMLSANPDVRPNYTQLKQLLLSTQIMPSTFMQRQQTYTNQYYQPSLIKPVTPKQSTQPQNFQLFSQRSRQQNVTPLRTRGPIKTLPSSLRQNSPQVVRQSSPAPFRPPSPTVIRQPSPVIISQRNTSVGRQSFHQQQRVFSTASTHLRQLTPPVITHMAPPQYLPQQTSARHTIHQSVPSNGVYISFGGENNRKQSSKRMYTVHEAAVNRSSIFDGELNIKDTHVNISYDESQQASNQMSRFQSLGKRDSELPFRRESSDLDLRVQRAIQQTQQTIERSIQMNQV